MPNLQDYLGKGEPITASDGATVFAPGDESRAFLIVTSGTVRVEQTNSAGRTVVLYRVTSGESCVLTTTCLLSDRPYAGYGYAEGNVTAVVIPAKVFRDTLRTDSAFQQLVFTGFAERISDLTDVIDDLLEHRTDQRLARWLSEQSSAEIPTKQSALAQELGTAREVVSRTLKSFEQKGWVRVSRGHISVLNISALARHGRSDGM